MDKFIWTHNMMNYFVKSIPDGEEKVKNNGGFKLTKEDIEEVAIDWGWKYNEGENTWEKPHKNGLHDYEVESLYEQLDDSMFEKEGVVELLNEDWFIFKKGVLYSEMMTWFDNCHTMGKDWLKENFSVLEKG